jgi:uncharacterized membrane protein YjjB (DUF3815 family)
MVVQAIVSFLAVLCFSVVLGIPKKFIILSGLTGTIGWIIFLIFSNLGLSTIIASLISAVCVAIISAILSKVAKTIISIFFIPGILPVVPGVAMYRAVYYVLNNDSEMTKQYLYETILIAGAIALSIFTVESIKKITIRKQ